MLEYDCNYNHISNYTNKTNTKLKLPIFGCVIISNDCASGHPGAPIKDPLKPPGHHGTVVLRGLSGALNWVLIMPRIRNISQRCDFPIFE